MGGGFSSSGTPQGDKGFTGSTRGFVGELPGDCFEKRPCELPTSQVGVSQHCEHVVAP